MTSRLPLLITYCFLLCCFSSAAQPFVEAGFEAGIQHSMNARGLMGGGAAFFDFDNDGWEDLYLTSGLGRDVLYRNNGDGTFLPAPNSNGLQPTQLFNTTAVNTADLDNDGDRDILVCTWEEMSGGSLDNGRNLLFRNNGDGTFTEIGLEAGLTAEVFSIGASFIDYDLDGQLDIYIYNHVSETAFLYGDDGGIIGFDHTCYPNLLYRNNGGLTFTEVGAALGAADNGCALAGIASDYDRDGDADLHLANDFGPFIVPNVLLENQYPIPSFNDVSDATGAGIPMYGMGIAQGDIDHDGDLDYYITNLGRNVLLQNNGGTFSDITTEADVENAMANDSELSTGWGTAFFDIDNDTWQDLFVANGRIPSLPSLPTAISDPDKLYLNNGDGTFTDITSTNGMEDPYYGRGMAWSDYDRDGDLDFVVVNLSSTGGFTRLYRNEQENGNYWVQFQLQGTASNRDAFGAFATLYTPSGEQVFEISGGGESFCSQHSSLVHFGLGSSPDIDSLKVDWPGSPTETYHGFEAGQRYTIAQFIPNRTTAMPAGAGIHVYPNPFREQLHISGLKQGLGPARAVLRSTAGQLVWETQLATDDWIDIKAALPKGAYLLEIYQDGPIRPYSKLVFKH